MELDPQLREQVRLSLLRFGLRRTRTGMFRAQLAGEGYKLTAEQVADEIQYLADKGLLVEENKLVSPENKFWRTTADGRDYLATQGEENA